MMSLDVRHDPDPAVLGSLHGLAELATDLGREWPELRWPLVLHWSEVPVLAVDRGHPWLYGPIERDPFARGGRTVVPRAQARQLRDLAARRLPVQRLAIAHELDPDGPVGALLPELRRGARTCTDEVARAVAGPLPAHPGVVRVARLVDRLVGATARAATGVLDPLLDPIIFGVIAPTRPIHGELCLWMPIIAWRW